MSLHDFSFHLKSSLANSVSYGVKLLSFLALWQISEIIIVLNSFSAALTQASVLWEVGLLMKKMSPQDWHAGKSVGYFLN